MVELEWLEAGSCAALECLTIQGGAFKVGRFPARFGLIRRAGGHIALFDTGYAPRFFEVTRSFPYRLYALVTPVELAPENSAVAQLGRRGILPEAVDTVILSHFHADHLGGLLDFPRAEIVANQLAYADVKPLSGLAAVRRGYIPQLLPKDFESRFRPAVFKPLKRPPFEQGADVFGDGSCVLVHLPGHAQGQVGMFVQQSSGPTLLAADACWHSRSYRENLDLPWLTHMLLSADRHQFRASLAKLCAYHWLHPEVPIYPTHCPEGMK